MAQHSLRSAKPMKGHTQKLNLQHKKIYNSSSIVYAERVTGAARAGAGSKSNKVRGGGDPGERRSGAGKKRTPQIVEPCVLVFTVFVAVDELFDTSVRIEQF